MTCGGENGTNGYHLALFSVDVAFSYHFVATHSPPLFHSVGVLVVLATPGTSKNLKWQKIQLAIHSIVGEYIDRL